jgi:hypothetical protein
MSLADGLFDGVSQTFTYTDYETTPDYCAQLLTYTYVSTVNPAETTLGPNNDDNSFDFVDKAMVRTYDSSHFLGGMSGGDFTYEYTVCIPNSVPENCAALNVPHKMIDPCNPPSSVVQLALTNQEYTITGVFMPYVHESFTMEPNYCTQDIQYTIPANSGITEPTGDDLTFNI